MSGYIPLQIRTLEVAGIDHALKAMRNPWMSHERADPVADLALAAKLIKTGDPDAKFARGIIVWFELECQIGWMVEWDTYRIGVECLSTSSTMHLNHKGLKGEALADAKQANLQNVVYKRTMLASYQALRRIYKQRRTHRHPDWSGVFCPWIASLPQFDTLIWPEGDA